MQYKMTRVCEFVFACDTDWDGILEDVTELEPFHRMVKTFSAAINLGPCVILLDGIDLLTETFGLSVQEVIFLLFLN